MDISNYKEVERIFGEAIDLPRSQRQSKITQLTNDPKIIQAVEDLLNEHDRLETNDFMKEGVLAGSLGSVHNPTELPIPESINGYTIIKQLGRGASGTVYLAKSPLPLERLVALKLIHQGAGKTTLARFREEQRVLAHLQHEGIAEVYDEGIAQGGRPFTVLEYIEGQSITEYCTTHNLNWQAIAELIIQCCQAVAHAHQRNIIHRDIKPSNLMVAPDEGKGEGSPRVKVIDFGTAKLADPFMMMTQLTMDTQFIGTLPYASPEQLSASDAPDTRTDVHALGIVLYECLAKKHPFFKADIGLKQAIDLIMAKPIPPLEPKPSMPTKEFNAILAKACAKDPDERYPSLVHFAEDLQNLLSALPVNAMRHQPVYVTRKFIRRHRASLSLAVVVLAMLATLAGIAIERGYQATKHRTAMRETAINLVDDLMPMLADLTGSTQARKELASSLHERIDELLLTDKSDATLLLLKAHILEYQSDMLLSDHKRDQSESLRIEAAEIVDSLLLKSNHQSNPSLEQDQRRLLIKIGDIAKDREDYNSALTYYQRNHDLLLDAPGDHRESLCWSYERLCWIAQVQRRREDNFSLALMRFNLSNELYDENPDDSSLVYNLAKAQQVMAHQYLSREKYNEAINAAQQAKQLATQLVELQPDHYSAREMELHAAVALTHALYRANQIQQADIQADIVRQLAFKIVEDNPNRPDVREIAWNKLNILSGFWSDVIPDRDRTPLHIDMRSLLPDRKPE